VISTHSLKEPQTHAYFYKQQPPGCKVQRGSNRDRRSSRQQRHLHRRPLKPRQRQRRRRLHSPLLPAPPGRAAPCSRLRAPSRRGRSRRHADGRRHPDRVRYCRGGCGPGVVRRRPGHGQCAGERARHSVCIRAGGWWAGVQRCCQHGSAQGARSTGWVRGLGVWLVLCWLVGVCNLEGVCKNVIEQAAIHLP